MTDSKLWILFFSLFLLLLLIVLYTLLRACCIFTRRYCHCIKQGRCCCYVRMDWEAYRNERDSLHRLRELRHRHRELDITQQLSTYSQIPGPIPDSVYILPSENNMGFILVPTEPGQSSLREQLSSEERIRILNRILKCHPYSERISSESIQDIEIGREKNDEVEQDTKDQEVATPKPTSTEESPSQPTSVPSSAPTQMPEQQEDPEVRKSIAIPFHEEPVDESSCAICLDAFAPGELINEPMDCPHFFHKNCLLGWLERHDVCPCCRRTMVTEQEWKRGMEEERRTPDESG